MHIVQVYHSKVPVRLYGGMERVIEALCQGLLELGHQVTLLCYEGDYKLPGVKTIFMDKEFKNHEEAFKGFTKLIPKDADVVHFHVPMNQVSLEIPQVTTMHGNLQEHEDPLKLHPNTIFLSKDHAQRHGREKYIFNGLNPEHIPFHDKSLSERTYFSFLGRASLKRKGLHLAKKIAKTFKTPLHIGGGRGLSFGATKYLGHLDDQQKFQLLGGSKALLFPILWEEPFGLVMIEALFCGTPVFALAHGSVSQVLGLEGFEGNCLKAANLDQLIEQIKSFDYSINPQNIRDYAMRNFTHIKMAQEYVKAYQAVI